MYIEIKEDSKKYLNNISINIYNTNTSSYLLNKAIIRKYRLDYLYLL